MGSTGWSRTALGQVLLALAWCAAVSWAGAMAWRSASGATHGRTLGEQVVGELTYGARGWRLARLGARPLLEFGGRGAPEQSTSPGQSPWLAARVAVTPWVGAVRVHLVGESERHAATLLVQPEAVPPVTWDADEGIRCTVASEALGDQRLADFRAELQAGVLTGSWDEVEAFRCSGVPTGVRWRLGIDGLGTGLWQAGYTLGPEAEQVEFEERAQALSRIWPTQGWLLAICLLVPFWAASDVWRGRARPGRVLLLWGPAGLVALALTGPLPGVLAALGLILPWHLLVRPLALPPLLAPGAVSEKWLAWLGAAGWFLGGLGLTSAATGPWSQLEGGLRWLRWSRPSGLGQIVSGVGLALICGLALAGLAWLMAAQARRRWAAETLALAGGGAGLLGVLGWFGGPLYFAQGFAFFGLALLGASLLGRAQARDALGVGQWGRLSLALLTVAALEGAVRSSPLDYAFLTWQAEAGSDLVGWEPHLARGPRVRFQRVGVEGVEDEELVVARTPGRPRLVTLGTSSTDGWGGTWPELWPNLLAEQLGAELGNAAIGGVNTPQLIAQYHWLGRRLNPDLVLVYIGANDATYTAAGPISALLEASGRSPLAPPDSSQLEASRWALQVGHIRLVRLYRDWLLKAAGRSEGGLACPPHDFERHWRWLIDTTAEDGARVVFVSEQIRTGFQIGWTDAILRRLAEEYDHVDYLDSSEWGLQSADYLDYVHLSTSGHHKAADGLARQLESIPWRR